MSDEKCAGKIWNGWNNVNCHRRGKVKRDGEWFCGIHDPVKVKERRAAKDAKFSAKSAVWRAAERLKNAESAVIKAAINAGEAPDVVRYRQELADAKVRLSAMERNKNALNSTDQTPPDPDQTPSDYSKTYPSTD